MLGVKRTFQACVDDNVLGENINIMREEGNKLLNSSEALEMFVYVKLNITTKSCLVNRTQGRIVI
jgi:hypothetical protein